MPWAWIFKVKPMRWRPSHQNKPGPSLSIPTAWKFCGTPAWASPHPLPRERLASLGSCKALVWVWTFHLSPPLCLVLSLLSMFGEAPLCLGRNLLNWGQGLVSDQYFFFGCSGNCRSYPRLMRQIFGDRKALKCFLNISFTCSFIPSTNTEVLFCARH
jgi:hypothetical protein